MAKRPSVPARAPRRAAAQNPTQQMQQTDNPPPTPTPPPSPVPAPNPTPDAVAALLLEVLRKAGSSIPAPNAPTGLALDAVAHYQAIASQLATLADPPALRRPL